MNVKKSIAFALCGLMIMLISSCKTYKDSLSVASSDPLEHKLPPMNIIYKNHNKLKEIAGSSTQSVGLGFPGIRTIFNEIKANCLDELNDSISGTIEVELTYGSYKHNIGLPILMGLTCGTLNLLGMPMTYTTFEFDVCFNVFNAENTLLKSYKYRKKSKKPVALYYGASGGYQQYLIGKYFAEQFKADLKKDIATLEPYFKERVYYPMGNNAGKHILNAEELCLSGKYKDALKELERARTCEDLNEFNELVWDTVYDAARSGRNAQLEQRAQAWAAIGTAVAVAGATTAAAVATSKSSSEGRVINPSGGTVSNTSNSTSGDNDNDSSSPSREKQKVMKDCVVCNGTGKRPDWNLSEGTGSLTYCSECKTETNPKHRHINCKICNGTGQVFDKYK